MSFFEKIRVGERGAAAVPVRSPVAAGPAGEGNRRPSNGLKDFMWLLSDVKQGQVLDLGQVSQATVAFFTERGFKIYSEDMLRGWKEFLEEEERRLRASSAAPAPVSEAGAAQPDAQYSRAALAKRFLETSLTYQPGTFHAVLLWDVLDYLDDELLPMVVARLFWMLRAGGVVLGLFHNKKPETFHRYRVPDAETIELIPANGLLPALRQMQNRDLMNLFAAYRSSKTFVGRDQLREALFLK